MNKDHMIGNLCALMFLLAMMLPCSAAAPDIPVPLRVLREHRVLTQPLEISGRGELALNEQVLALYKMSATQRERIHKILLKLQTTYTRTILAHGTFQTKHGITYVTLQRIYERMETDFEQTRRDLLALLTPEQMQIHGYFPLFPDRYMDERWDKEPLPVADVTIVVGKVPGLEMGELNYVVGIIRDSGSSQRTTAHKTPTYVYFEEVVAKHQASQKQKQSTE